MNNEELQKLLVEADIILTRIERIIHYIVADIKSKQL